MRLTSAGNGYVVLQRVEDLNVVRPDPTDLGEGVAYCLAFQAYCASLRPKLYWRDPSYKNSPDWPFPNLHGELG